MAYTKNHKGRVYGPPTQTGFGIMLTDQQVNAVRNVTTGTLKEAAKRFGISEATISDIWHNRGRFANVPFVQKKPSAAETTEG